MSDSRLTSFPALPTPSAEKVPGIAFRRLNGRVLVSEDGGGFASMSEADFRRWLAGSLAEGEPLLADVRERGLDRQALDFQKLAPAAVRRHMLDSKGPVVHTLVVTRRCNFACSYCHASVVGEKQPGYDMSAETARQAVDFAFSTPSPELMLEFQGGEPLLNWPVVRFVSEYARLRARASGRTLRLSLISNFSLLDDAKIEFLASRKVSFCTSLDGPADLHDGNRRWLGGQGHAETVRRLKMLQARRAGGLELDPPNAICTVTRASLGRAEEIVDQAVELGLERIQLGPLDPIGFARRAWDKIGYEPEAFAAFYRRAIERVLEHNRKGVKAYEKMALIFLVRILRGEQWRFPNGDGLCRLAYDHDGSIYTCEEGRLLAADGDDAFRLGRVGETSWLQVLDAPAVRASLLAQSLAYAQPLCSQCVYRPWCTTQPVANYATQGGPWGRLPDNAWCRLLMGVFDVLFEKLDEPESRKLLESWLEFKDR